MNYSKFSFDNWQLFSLFVLKQKANQSYKDFVEEWLPCATVILQYLRLKQVPSASCLIRFANRLRAYWANSIIEQTAKLAGIDLAIVGIDGSTSTTKYGSRHYYKRIAKKLKKKDSVKWVPVVELKKQLILAVKVRKKARHDNVDFKPTMRRARRVTKIKTGIGDKGFYKEVNYVFFEEEIGG